MKFEFEIENYMNQPYKYGFTTHLDNNIVAKGLNTSIIRQISNKKKEPKFMLDFRLNAFKNWKKFTEPKWAYLSYKKIKYQGIRYYSAPKTKKFTTLTEINSELKKILENLGLSFFEKPNITNCAVDIIFDSISIGTTFKSELSKFGIIFCSITDAIQLYPELIKSYLGTVVPYTDNFFAALNTSVFTDGSFCYIPKKVYCPIDLSTYFRISDEESGQFERTLLIADQESHVSYLEGCTALKYNLNQLHAAVVELVILDYASIKYSTIQNWYPGDKNGNGGIYNFVTKRGLCAGIYSKVTWTQVETGAAITWKYPSCILLGSFSKGSFYSITITTNFQQSDTGTKMIHLSNDTRSHIISKGLSSGYSKNSYRGLVKIGGNSARSYNFSQCDSLLMGVNSAANTFPYLSSQNSTSKIEHEASISKIGQEQIFYFQQRGINVDQATNLILSGFYREICTKLPFEFALEANRLLNLKLEKIIKQC